MVTLKDIAKQVGISTAAVSLVLSGKGRVSSEMRKNVFAAARSLGYRSGRIRFPDERPTAMMLLPVHETRAHVWHFLKDCIETIQQSMTARGCSSVLLPITREQQPDDILELIVRTGTSALFSIHYGDEHLFNAATTLGIPLIVVNNSDYQRNFNCVCVDDFQGAYEAGCLLLDLGHTSVGYLDYPRPELPIMFSDRYVGFRKAVDEHGLEYSDDRHITVPLDEPETLISRLRRLFESSAPPTALLAHDDFLANRVYHILLGMGLRVPEDVSLIAPGDTLDYRQPETTQISTMRVNTYLLGRYAAEMMQRLMDSARIPASEARRDSITAEQETNQVLKIRQQLVDRGSVRAPGRTVRQG